MALSYAAALTAAAYGYPAFGDVLRAYALEAVDTGPAGFAEADLVRATSGRPDAVAGLWLKPPVLDVRAIAAACATPLDSALADTVIKETELRSDQASVLERALVVLLKPHEPVTGNRCRPCGCRWPCAQWQEVYLWLSGYFDPVTGGRVTMSGEHWTGQLCPLDDTSGPDANCKCAQYDALLRLTVGADATVDKPVTACEERGYDDP